MRYVSQHGVVLDSAGIGIFIRDTVVTALFVVWLFIGMFVAITGMVFDGAKNFVGFMGSPAHAFLVSVFTAIFS